MLGRATPFLVKKDDLQLTSCRQDIKNKIVSGKNWREKDEQTQANKAKRQARALQPVVAQGQQATPNDRQRVSSSPHTPTPAPRCVFSINPASCKAAASVPCPLPFLL